MNPEDLELYKQYEMNTPKCGRCKVTLEQVGVGIYQCPECGRRFTDWR